MKKRMIGNLEVSEVAMGCMGFSHGYGKVPEESYSIEAIQEAYQFDCTFFDTAEAYEHRSIEESKNKSFSANWRKK